MADPRAGELVTANYGWTKPTVGGSADGWGAFINTDLDSIDSTVHGIDIRVIPTASSSAPVMDGTAAAGAATTWSRGDHVHPTDTTRYAATNPSGYQTAANVTASLAPYATTAALASYLPVAGGSVGPLVIGGPADLKVQTVTQSGASLAINRALGENCTLSLTAAITGVTVTGWPASGVTGKVRLIVANTGAFSIAGWPAGTLWPGGTPPTITSGAGKTDIILLMSDNAGATIYGSVVGQDYR